MKKIIAILVLSLLLTSCFNKTEEEKVVVDTDSGVKIESSKDNVEVNGGDVNIKIGEDGVDIKSDDGSIVVDDTGVKIEGLGDSIVVDNTGVSISGAKDDNGSGSDIDPDLDKLVDDLFNTIIEEGE